MKPFTLRMLRNTDFLDLYQAVIRKDHLNMSQREALLKIAIILINAGDLNCENLGYRLIVLYCNQFNDFIPLYDLSINKGYIPILKIIENLPELRDQFAEKFFNVLASSTAETYRENNIYLTQQQINLTNFFRESDSKTIAVIAPTSYGKSELIVDYCKRHLEENICILVPTKALLAQTRRRLLHSHKDIYKRKIITHPEMFNEGDDNFIAVLTQERLLRLLRKDIDLFFDTVFIDEAHNALENDQRNILLLKTIAVLEYRNQDTSFKFLTPFLVDASNLKARYTDYDIEQFKVDENIKTERYFAIDFGTGGILKAYDQYLNEFIKVHSDQYKDDIDFIALKSAKKNIIYLNSPPKIESFSKRLENRKKVIEDEELDEARNDISKFLHKDYTLINCLKRGFAYHHGSVPDIVKLYVEELFTNNENIQFLVTSSTLLEGVNIPAENLFLLEYMKGPKKLSPSQFKNLTGRVCRFSEIFDKDNPSLELLEPKIYIIKSEYIRKKANIEKFLVDSVKIDKIIKDEPNNVMLVETEINKKNEYEKEKADEELENIQNGITGLDTSYANTEVGKLCYLNNITEISIIEHENEINESIKRIEDTKLNTPEKLVHFICNTFIPHVNEKNSDFTRLERLKNESAQDFYCMLVKWRMRNASYNEMIKNFLMYWLREDTQNIVYVGKWGDTVKEGFKEQYINVTEKTNSELVNLAIVRIKEEQDFLDNTIIKFVEVLYDLDLVDESMYLKIKYGTEDPRKIIMIKNGISSTLSTLIVDRYMEYVEIDIASNTVVINEQIVGEMETNGENRVMIFEIGFNVSKEMRD